MIPRQEESTAQLHWLTQSLLITEHVHQEQQTLQSALKSFNSLAESKLSLHSPPQTPLPQEDQLLTTNFHCKCDSRISYTDEDVSITVQPQEEMGRENVGIKQWENNYYGHCISMVDSPFKLISQCMTLALSSGLPMFFNVEKYGKAWGWGYVTALL